jgi:hypothetical protein
VHRRVFAGSLSHALPQAAARITSPCACCMQFQCGRALWHGIRVASSTRHQHTSIRQSQPDTTPGGHVVSGSGGVQSAGTDLPCWAQCDLVAAPTMLGGSYSHSGERATAVTQPNRSWRTFKCYIQPRLCVCVFRSQVVLAAGQQRHVKLLPV